MKIIPKVKHVNCGAGSKPIAVSNVLDDITQEKKEAAEMQIKSGMCYCCFEEMERKKKRKQKGRAC